MSLKHALPIKSSNIYHIVSPLSDRQLISSHILFWHDLSSRTYLFDFGVSIELLMPFQSTMTNFLISPFHKRQISPSSFVLGVPVQTLSVAHSSVTSLMLLDWGLSKGYTSYDYVNDLRLIDRIASILSSKYKRHLELFVKPRYSSISSHFNALTSSFTLLSGSLSLTDVINLYGSSTIFLHYGSTSMYELSSSSCRQINLAHLLTPMGPESLPRSTTTIGYLPSCISALAKLDLDSLETLMLSDNTGICYDINTQVNQLLDIISH